MQSTRSIRLPDGRSLAFDDVGDPGGAPVVYLHGTPDSRLARHPDDGIAAAAGVRLLAVDRPGAGASDPNGAADLTSLGDDLGSLLDHLGLTRASLLGWSAGGLVGTAAATVLGPMLERVVLVGTRPPVEASDDPVVVSALGSRRRHFVELAAQLPAAELAAELVFHLVPQPLTHELAADHILEGAGERGRAELESVPGALGQMVSALEASVAQGTAGLAHDVELQLERGLDLSRIEAQVLTEHGTEDDVSPVAVGTWLAHAAPGTSVAGIPGAGHHLIFPLWGELLRTAAHGDALRGVQG